MYLGLILQFSQGTPVFPEYPFDCIDKLVGYFNIKLPFFNKLFGLEEFQGALGAACVCPRKTAGSQFCSAEIPGNNNDNIDNVAASYHL